MKLIACESCEAEYKIQHNMSKKIENRAAEIVMITLIIIVITLVN